jgi:hypothetical protein
MLQGSSPVLLIPIPSPSPTCTVKEKGLAVGEQAKAEKCWLGLSGALDFVFKSGVQS